MHQLLDRIERDETLEAEYAAAKAQRAITDLGDLSAWPDGLAERFTRRLDLIRSWSACDSSGLWGGFKLRLVSSWVDGSGVDELTEKEEPEFWQLKMAHKTWGGRFSSKMKLSDFDLNLFTVLGAPVATTGLWDLDDNGIRVRVDMYPFKGERGIDLWQ
jgi:hypothetical protein